MFEQANSQKTFIVTALLLWMGHFCVDMMIGIWPVYKTIAHLDLAKAGLISACCAFAGESLQILFGTLSDQGYRKLLIICGIATTAASSLLVYTQDYSLIFILVFLTCLGSGAFHPAAVSWMGSLSKSRKGLMITIFASGGSLGIALSQLIFSHTFYYFDGHTYVFALPLMTLALFFGISRLVNIAPIYADSKKSKLKVYMGFFQNIHLRALYISQVCNQTLFWGFIFLLPDILTEREYDSWVSLGGGHFFLIIGSVCMLAPSGYLADKYSFRSVIIGATLVGLVLFYIFLFYPLLPIPVLLTLLFCLGAAIGIVNPVSVALGNRLMPENPGMISAFLMGMVWCISEGIGQGGGGLLTKLFEQDAPAKALGILGVAFFIGLAATIRLPLVKSVENLSETTN